MLKHNRNYCIKITDCEFQIWNEENKFDLYPFCDSLKYYKYFLDIQLFFKL